MKKFLWVALALLCTGSVQAQEIGADSSAVELTGKDSVVVGADELSWPVTPVQTEILAFPEAPIDPRLRRDDAERGSPLPLVAPGIGSLRGLDRDSSATSPRRFNSTRFYGGVGALVVADVAVMVGLSSLWYSGARVPFHWYSETEGLNDDGWLDDWHTYVQQDKGGHAFVAWQLARVLGAYGQWSGLSDKQAGLFGGSLSALFQSQIEIFDGMDPEYGASRTDIAANFVGAAIGGLQVAYPEKLGWFTSKYSYNISPYYDQTISSNPVLRYVGNVIKDYDGISYWLVVRPKQLLPERQAARWPRWLALSVGYSGDGLAHPISGLTEPRNVGLPNVHRRQFFVGLDFDFLETEKHRLPKLLQPVATFFSFVRIPAPALELGGRGTRWHWLYW